MEDFNGSRKCDAKCGGKGRSSANLMIKKLKVLINVKSHLVEKHYPTFTDCLCLRENQCLLTVTLWGKILLPNHKPALILATLQ